jgi:hypothetical protein
MNIDIPSKLAADTRRAHEEVRALDRCGRPVLTVEREAAQARLDDALEAERRYWCAR